MDGQAGRRAVVTPADPCSRLDDGGFILVALLIGIAVASVWMAALLPSWRQQVIRERETELIFRGQQYARAIRLYQQQMGGVLPTSFDDLVSQHFLRHKWKDPITDDEFLPRANCAQFPIGAGVGGGGVPGGAGGRGPAGSSGPGRGAGGGPSGSGLQQPPQSNFQQLQSQGQRGAQPGIQQPAGRGQVAGGICGVQSKSNATSIKIYNGQQEYDLWQFDLTTAAMQYQQTILKYGLVGGAAQPRGFPANGVGPGATPRGGASPGGGRNPFGNGFPGRGLQPGGQGSQAPGNPPPNAPRPPVSGGGRN